MALFRKQPAVLDELGGSTLWATFAAELKLVGTVRV
jgi:hypothetical protein